MNPYTVNGLKFFVKNGVATCLTPICMDIETSNNHAEKPEDLITWMTSCQILMGDEYHLFRSPWDVVDWFTGLYNKYNLYSSKSLKKRMIIYVHNLSYDIMYLAPFFEQALPDYGEGSFGIIPKSHQFITYTIGSLEFRCSYRLSGSSLEKWSKDMQVEHQKLVGWYDYSKVIYQDTELTENEQDYDKVDVQAMQECLEKVMAGYKDTLATIPFTKTGYIRRELRKSCRQDDEYRKKYFRNTQMDAELYKAMHEAYAGGYTHNNRFLRDKLITGLIGHRDFKSHYPSQMTCYQFPVGKPEKIYDIENCNYYVSIEDSLALYPEYSTLTTIIIYKAILKDVKTTMPVLAFARCVGKPTHSLVDNGRVIMIESDEGLVGNFTNQDLEMINKQYDMDYAIVKVWRMKNDYLPKCVIDVVDRAFKGKSDMKKVMQDLEKQFGELDPRTREAAFDLQQHKATVNGIYGCCATNPLRDSFEMNENMEFRLAGGFSTLEEIEEGLAKFYSKRNNFLPYQWGVWITALARYELFQYIEAIGYDNCLYCDTDSIFYIKTDAIENKIEALNAEKKENAHYVILDNGKKEYYDAFVSEDDCVAFKGLHSKCYGVVTKEHNELKLTIAGVPARTMRGMKDGKPDYFTREQELAGKETDPIKALDKLKFGTEFTVNTGSTAIYVGATGAGSLCKPTLVEVDGHEVWTAGGCVIKKTEKKVIRDMTYDETYEMDIFGINE